MTHQQTGVECRATSAAKMMGVCVCVWKAIIDADIRPQHSKGFCHCPYVSCTLTMTKTHAKTNTKTKTETKKFSCVQA